MLREVSSLIDKLAMGKISHYLIPLSLVQNILTSASAGPASPIQTHLAFSLGSAIPLYVDPEAGDLAFLLSLSIIDANDIYRLKDMLNVVFWQGNTYVKIYTPEVVVYHDKNELLYLAPNLKMCTLTKDIHFLCSSKPFVRDNTESISGLESIRTNTSCLAEATPHSQVEATLTYNQHDTAMRIILSNQTLWFTVPRLELPYWRFSITMSIRLNLKSHPFQTVSLHSRNGRKDQGGRNATHWFDCGRYSFGSYCSPSVRHPTHFPTW